MANFKDVYPDMYYQMLIYQPCHAGNSLSIVQNRGIFEKKDPEDGSPALYKTLVVSLLATIRPILPGEKEYAELWKGDTVFIPEQKYEEVSEHIVGGHDISFLVKHGYLDPNIGVWKVKK